MDLIIDVVSVGQLKANNTQLMEEAVQAMQNLTQQCSDPTAVQDIVTHLFKILGGEMIFRVLCFSQTVCVIGSAHLKHYATNAIMCTTIFMAAGSEGKLTVVAQKMSVLSGKRLCKKQFIMYLFLR